VLASPHMSPPPPLLPSRRRLVHSLGHASVDGQACLYARTVLDSGVVPDFKAEGVS